MACITVGVSYGHGKACVLITAIWWLVLYWKTWRKEKGCWLFIRHFLAHPQGLSCKSWRERATSPFQKLMQHGSSSCRTHRLSGVYVALGRWEMVLSSRKHCSQGTLFNSCGWQTSVSGVLRKTLREIIVSKRETPRESQLFGAVCADGLLLCGGGGWGGRRLYS